MVLGATDVPDRGPQLVAVAAICTFLVLTSNLVRFWSRFVGPEPSFWWDDWICLATIPLTIVMNVLCWVSISLGYGRHGYLFGPMDEVRPTIALISKLMWSSFMFDFALLLCVKLSALCFYARIFKNMRRFGIVLWVVGVACFLWFAMAIVVTSLSCEGLGHILPASWSDRCIATAPSLYIPTIPDLTLDIIILLLPMPKLWTLNTIRTNRLMLIGIFAAGYSVPILSFFNMITTIETTTEFAEDPMWGSVPRTNLAVIEVGVGVFCICIPSMFALWKQSREQGWRSLFTTQFQRLQALDKANDTLSTGISDASGPDLDIEMDFMEMLRSDRAIKKPPEPTVANMFLKI